jgi:hypothetical protein
MKLKVKMIMFIGVVALLSGCANMIRQSEAVSKAPSVIAPPSDKAMLVFYHQGVLYPQADTVFVDGKPVASLERYEKSYVFVEPGYHKLVVLAYPLLFAHATAEANVEAGGIYYLGFENAQNGFFQIPGYNITLNNAPLQDKEFGDDVVFWLKKADLVALNEQAAAKALANNKEDIDQAFADAEEDWADTPQDERVWLIKSKRIDEVDWYIDGKVIEKGRLTLPYGNL